MNYGDVIDKIGSKRGEIAKLFNEIQDLKSNGLSLLNEEIKALKHLKKELERA